MAVRSPRPHTLFPEEKTNFWENYRLFVVAFRQQVCLCSAGLLVLDGSEQILSWVAASCSSSCKKVKGFS